MLVSKIYADLFLKNCKQKIETKILHILKNIKVIFLAVSLTKLYVLMINLAKQMFYRKKLGQYVYLSNS